MLRKCVFLSVVIVMILSLLACGGAAPVEEEVEEVEFTLKIRVIGKGTTSPKPGTSTITEGESVTVTAKPGKGYKFDGWKGDVSGTNTSITFKMTSDKRVVAVFVEEVIVEEAPALTPVSRSVSVTLDSGRSASAIITAEGGTISTSAADGTPFTLSFPVEAVLGPTEVTLTPVSAMEGLPLSGDLVAALQLEPEGLRLLKPATLTIELPYLIPSKYLIGFAYHGTGEGFHLTPLEVNGTTLTFKLMHFSGIGAGTGTDYDCHALASDDSLLPEAGAQEQIAYVNATYMNATEKDLDAALDACIDILRVWFQESVLPKLNGADNWETFIKAQSELNKWLRYYYPLDGLDPGLDEDYDSALEALGDAIQRVLHKENALGICNTGPEDEMVHRERLLYLQKVVDLLVPNREELVWLHTSLCTISVDLKAVLPGTNIGLGEPKLKPGETSEGLFELIATVTDPGGVAYDMSELPCVSIFWQSCCPFTLAVDQDGVVTGRNPGKACVTASITGIDDAYIMPNRPAEVMVTVTSVVHVVHVVASISVDFVETEGRLARGLLFPDEIARLIVTAKDKSGNPVPWPEPWDVKLVLFGPHGLETDHADCITVSEWEFSDQYSGVVSPSVLITAVEVGWVQPHVYVSGAGWSQDYGWKDIAVLPDLAGTWKGTFPVEDSTRTWGPGEFGEHGEYSKTYSTNRVRLTITHDPAGEGYLLQLSGKLAWTEATSGERCIGLRMVQSLETGEVRDVECVGLVSYNEMESFNHELDQTINIPYDSSLSWYYQIWKDGKTEDIWYFLIYNELILRLYSPDHIRGYEGTVHFYFDLYR